jgi:hypothetical protein
MQFSWPEKNIYLISGRAHGIDISIVVRGIVFRCIIAIGIACMFARDEEV